MNPANGDADPNGRSRAGSDQNDRKSDGAVKIFDTTLRDGEQSPGASLTSAEKLELARQLAILGVDIIEAGFPAASPDDLEGVRRIAATVGTEQGPVIAGLARTSHDDIDRAWEAVREAAKPRIHCFIATSALHMERKLGLTPAEVLSRTVETVGYAASLCRDVEFSAEDASRSDPAFLAEVLEAAIASGATTVNIPDTVGYALPQEYGALIANLIAQTPGAGDVIWSVHCHDDLGLATANTLAGLQAGARQAEVTINGLGERAGNASLEEVVMALYTRRGAQRLSTAVNTRHLARSSRMVSHYTGMVVPPNKAIVGANAFAHEAGIHQHGMLQDRRTYEIMTPQTVGAEGSRLVLGKHSGKHAVRQRLEQLGIDVPEASVGELFRAFKALADRKKTVTDADLRALVTDEVQIEDALYELVDLQVSCGRPGLSTATVRLSCPGGHERVAASVADGPVNAAFRAIDSLLETPNTLIEYAVHGVTAGRDALGEVTVRLAPEDSVDEGNTTSFGGYGADTDVIAASAKAYLSALNQLIAANGLQAVASAAVMTEDYRSVNSPS
ncbi:MAG: 2-isopropylmalate synthase [Thermoanaerobaculia bacterium]|nr:2-isopropylmalate synthase [Thermoanaerobaculia bacterium]